MSRRKETVIDLTTQRLPDASPRATIDLGTVRHADGTMGIAVEITSADGTKAGALLTTSGAQEIGDCLKTLARSLDVLARRGN